MEKIILEDVVVKSTNQAKTVQYQPMEQRVTDLLHTTLYLEFDYQRQWVRGEAVLKLKPYAQSLRSIDLDARNFYLLKVGAIKDKYDALLSQLGMDKLMGNKNNHIKAPMPGLVLRIMAQEGDTVKKGDALLVLEAMKMENIIKADGEGKVKRINVSTQQAVEKNTLLIEMEA